MKSSKFTGKMEKIKAKRTLKPGKKKMLTRACINKDFVHSGSIAKYILVPNVKRKFALAKFLSGDIS